MKLTFLLILLTYAGIFASESYSQTTKLTLFANNLPLEDFLTKIEDQSEFRFFYTGKIDVEQKITGDFENKKISEILDEIAKTADFKYEVMGRQIILSPPEMIIDFTLQQQQNIISGKVTDDSGQPLPGVTVMVKGTMNGTVTDVDGNYSLRNVPPNGTLQFSFVGMRSQEIAVNNQSSINVTMNVDAIGIEEVVAIGYGTMKKVNLTGSVSNVNAEELTEVPMPTIAQSIMGRASGVFVKNTNGQPGETEIDFNIRGFGSPLLIIDGMPASEDDFKQLDPNDIKDFSVLKDAASAAVYGARAGNGVILVTTKRGSISEAKVTYTGNFGVQFFPVVPNFVSSEEYARMENLSRYNQGLDPIWSDELIQKFADGSDPNRYPNNDWWSLTLRKFAPQTQHNINVQGGTEKVRYFVSGGYFYQEAMPRANDTKYKKYNFRSNLDIALAKRLNMNVDLALQYQDFIGPVFQMERTGSKTGLMGKIYRHRPFGPSPDQYPDPNILTSYPGADINPLIYSEMDNGGYKSWNTLTGDLKFAFTYQLPFGIEAKANYRLYRRYDRDKQYELKTAVYNYDWDTQEYSLRSYLNDPSRLYERMRVNSNLDQQYYLTWNREFGDHSINALAVYEILSDDNNWFDASRIRYDFDIDYLFAGPDLDKDNGGSAGEGGRKGLITRFNYGYKGKYLLEFNSRYDASPRFPKETRWGFFPSASIAWRLSEEDFIKDNSILFPT